MTRKTTKEEFIEKAKQKHNDKYDYSLIIYENATSMITIVCKDHGPFIQKASGHLWGYGCPFCGGVGRSTTESFITKATKIHYDTYDYSKTEYNNIRSKVIIICKIHGEFCQRPNNHLSGKGCNKCKTKTIDQFIIDAQKVHGDLYDYSKSIYKNSRIKINITCKNHGEFFQSPSQHITRANGCPICVTSKGEGKIRKLLTDKDIDFEEQYKFHLQKSTIISRCRYDFYIPVFNLVIEYHGIQHYEFVSFFHKKIENFNRRVIRDKNKKLFCQDNNIPFVEISYKDNIEETIDEILKQHIQIAGNS